MSRVGPLNPRGDDRVTVVTVTHNVAAAMYGDRTPRDAGRPHRPRGADSRGVPGGRRPAGL